MFKSVLHAVRTFESEILKIFKNIQPQPGLSQKFRRPYKNKQFGHCMHALLLSHPLTLLGLSWISVAPHSVLFFGFYRHTCTSILNCDLHSMSWISVAPHSVRFFGFYRHTLR